MVNGGEKALIRALPQGRLLCAGGVRGPADHPAAIGRRQRQEEQGREGQGEKTEP